LADAEAMASERRRLWAALYTNECRGSVAVSDEEIAKSLVRSELGRLCELRKLLDDCRHVSIDISRVEGHFGVALFEHKSRDRSDTFTATACRDFRTVRQAFQRVLKLTARCAVRAASPCGAEESEGAIDRECSFMADLVVSAVLDGLGPVVSASYGRGDWRENADAYYEDQMSCLRNCFLRGMTLRRRQVEDRLRDLTGLRDMLLKARLAPFQLSTLRHTVVRIACDRSACPDRTTKGRPPIRPRCFD
jgi:hypothetical protein